MKKVDAEVRKIIDEQYALARKLLEDNRDKVEAMAKALLELETIDADQIDDIMAGKPPRPPKPVAAAAGHAVGPANGGGLGEPARRPAKSGPVSAPAPRREVQATRLLALRGRRPLANKIERGAVRSRHRALSPWRLSRLAIARCVMGISTSRPTRSPTAASRSATRALEHARACSTTARTSSTSAASRRARRAAGRRGRRSCGACCRSSRRSRARARRSRSTR